MFNLDKIDPLTIQSLNGVSKPRPTSIENIAGTYESMRALDNTSSETDLLKEEWQSIVDRVNENTEGRFYNPANDLGGGLISAPMTQGTGAARYNYQTREIFRHIQNNEDLYPDLIDLTNESILDRVKQRALMKKEDMDELVNRSEGILDDIEQFIGGVGAAATDQLNLELILVNPLAGINNAVRRSLTGLLFREALIGAGAEAITQVGVRDWYKSLGLEYEWSDFYQNVAIGGAFGAGVPLTFKIAGKTVNITAEQAKKGYDAIKKSGFHKGNRKSETIESVVDDLEYTEKLNPINDPIEHQARVDRAQADIESGNAPAMPDNPNSGYRLRDVDEVDNLDGVVTKFDPDKVEVDAKLFQFKEGGDEFGVTERLRGVEQWDPVKSGQVVVYEFADGRQFIADGHQRLALAKRIKAQDPEQKVNLYGTRLREVDGVTPEQARVVAAVKNIAEGTGSAVDAAKILRISPERAGELPPRSSLVRQAQDLTALDDELFMMVVNGNVKANYAAIVGRLIPEDVDLQGAAMQVLAKSSPANEFQAEAIVRQIRESGVEQMTQTTLFGDEMIAESLFFERANILDRAQKEIRKDRATFLTLSNQADRVEVEGNKLVKEANLKRADDDAMALAVLQSEANRKGALSDALTNAAREAKQTGNFAAATRGFLDAVRTANESGDFARADVGDAGRAIDFAEETSKGQAEINVEEFDEPGGAGVKRQADQAELDIETDGLPDDTEVPTSFFEGEFETTKVQTIGELKEEFAQDQRMLERLRGCVK